MDKLNDMRAGVQAGFKYVVEHFRNGERIGDAEDCNLIPTQGLNHILDVLLKSGAQVPAWYIGLYEGNYTPVPAVTGATVVASATECTAYDEVTRPQWEGGAVADGFVTNEDNRAVFTMNAVKSVYGGFMVSSAVKGASSDVLLSIVRFSTVKQVEPGDLLRVRAEFATISAT